MYVCVCVCVCVTVLVYWCELSYVATCVLCDVHVLIHSYIVAIGDSFQYRI